MRERTTDPRRVAQLLASELDGRERGAFGAVVVVDADPDAEPAPDGPAAYAVDRAGERVAVARLYPDGLVLDAEASVAEAAREAGLSVEAARVTVPDGAAVKAAARALTARGKL